MNWKPTFARDADARHALLRRVDDAFAALRRGRLAAVTDGERSILCLAAESVTPETMVDIKRRSSETPMVALTANRAAVLRINPTGADIIRMPVATHFNARLIRSLADPTHDLDNPMRGPFARSWDAVPAAVRAAIKLCKLGQLLPAVVTVPVDMVDSDSIPSVSAEDIEAYDEVAAISLRPVSSARVPLHGAENTRVIAFRPEDGGVEHLAIVIGDPPPDEPVLIRLHSECFTGDLLGSLKCDCGQQLQGAIAAIGAAGSGILLYLAQEGRGIGLINKLRAYHLQDDGFDTVEANERLGFDADERLFLPAAEMLRNLGFDRVRLMTNNPDKVDSLARFGIEVVERVPHEFPSNAHNELYLATKAKRSGHYLSGPGLKARSKS
ncbi:GTP cyclohydrolase II [Iodidimonas sp. SYSU 1G8]|uniref:GTP cyclohydrolase II n=1 Tax=Iodidimonas sp. SYSU 1G8 TaxID=3133967 RepID=UPI0031FEE48D